MKLVQTLVVRDEADIVDDQIAYHLNAGVDFVIASDHESPDGTTEILESYARDGVPAPDRRCAGEMRDGPWRTRMARLAATEYGADWVINTDADEFWMPRDGTLKDVLAAVPERRTVSSSRSAGTSSRDPTTVRSFAERMTVRVVAAGGDQRSDEPVPAASEGGPPRGPGDHGQLRLAHRRRAARWRALHNWHPADVLHFPFRSLAQWENKGVAAGAGRQAARAVRHRASGAGERDGAPIATARSSSTTRRSSGGCATGSLVVDTRLRDALRALGACRSTTRADPSRRRAAVRRASAVRDADLVRLQRYLDGLAVRVGRARGRGTA